MGHEMEENLYFTSSPHSPVMDNCLCSFVDRGSDILVHNSGTFYHINKHVFWYSLDLYNLLVVDATEFF